MNKRTEINKSINKNFVLNENKILKSLYDAKYLILLVTPAIIYYIVFEYLPMWGILVAFKKFSPYKGFFDSPWVGFKYFKMFFEAPNAWQLIRNTILLNIYQLLWGFPAPIIFALILNEINNVKLKKVTQTITYMPHFISTVVVVGLVHMFVSPSTGPINKIIVEMGYKKIDFFADPKYFRTLYVSSGVWRNMGWGAIIYLAALTNIDPGLFEAATIDGANKFQKIIHITLPCIAPTIVIIFLLRIGHLMSVGFEKAFLMQYPANYETSDIISTYIYRRGIRSGNFSYATAVGLFNALINLIFILTANNIARRVNETSLW